MDVAAGRQLAGPLWTCDRFKACISSKDSFCPNLLISHHLSVLHWFVFMFPWSSCNSLLKLLDEYTLRTGEEACIRWTLGRVLDTFRVVCAQDACAESTD